MRISKHMGRVVMALGIAALAMAVAPAVWAQSNQGLDRGHYTFTFGSQFGATIRDVTEADVKNAKLSGVTGAMLDAVPDSGQAARAGFKPGDVVLSFDSENVRSARHLQRLIDETPAGREVAVTVMRAGERVNLKLKLESQSGHYFGALSSLNSLHNLQMNMPELSQFRNDFRVNVPDFFYFNNATGRLGLMSDRRLRLGIGAQEMTSQLGEYFGTPAGVLVTEVDDNAAGKTAGLRAGDVITKVNDQAVRSMQDLRRVLGNASGEITLTVMRERKEQTLKVKLQDEALETPGRVIRR